MLLLIFGIKSFKVRRVDSTDKTSSTIAQWKCCFSFGLIARPAWKSLCDLFSGRRAINHIYVRIQRQRSARCSPLENVKMCPLAAIDAELTLSSNLALYLGQFDTSRWFNSRRTLRKDLIHWHGKFSNRKPGNGTFRCPHTHIARIVGGCSSSTWTLTCPLWPERIYR